MSLRLAISITLLFGWLAVITTSPAAAHFVVLLPSDDVVESGHGRDLALQLMFTHPMQQGPVMEMERPRHFGVLVGGKKIDLLESLQPRKLSGKTAYTAAYRLAQPGDHIFFVEPAPYWEPSERKMLLHYAKVVVDFLGAEQGWDAPVGLPVEIEPLTRPYGLWTGNCFRGIVRKNGRAVPFTEVEVEYYNVDRQITPPNDALVTQVVKTDAQGVFCYAIPRAGWWGFAALVPGDDKLKSPTGEMVDVELGGVIWVKAVDMVSK